MRTFLESLLIIYELLIVFIPFCLVFAGICNLLSIPLAFIGKFPWYIIITFQTYCLAQFFAVFARFMNSEYGQNPTPVLIASTIIFVFVNISYISEHGKSDSSTTCSFLWYCVCLVAGSIFIHIAYWFNIVFLCAPIEAFIEFVYWVFSIRILGIILKIILTLFAFFAYFSLITSSVVTFFLVVRTLISKLKPSFPNKTNPPEPSRAKDIPSIFEKHDSAIFKILSSYTSTQNRKFNFSYIELGALMYVISDIAILSAHKEMRNFSQDAGDWCFEKVNKYMSPEEFRQKFQDHLSFYASVVRGVQLRGLCLPGADLSVFDDNPVHRCAIAFVDRFLAAECINDYDNAPSPVYSSLELLNVRKIILSPLMDELVSLYNEMYDL